MVEATAVEPTTPAMAAPAMAPMATAETEAEGDRRPIIVGIIGIGRIVIDRRRRRGRIAIGISRRRSIISSLAAVLMHAGIIGIGIGGFDIARRMAGIVGPDGGAGDQAGARAG